MFSTQLSEDGFTGYFLSGLIELPAGIISVGLLLKFGRRSVTVWSLVLQGVSMGAAILYPGNHCYASLLLRFRAQRILPNKTHQNRHTEERVI